MRLKRGVNFRVISFKAVGFQGSTPWKSMCARQLHQDIQDNVCISKILMTFRIGES